MKKQVLFVLALAALVATGTFAQKVGDTIQAGGQEWIVLTLSGDTMVLQKSTGSSHRQRGSAQQMPAAPTGLTATAVSSSRIDLKWNAVSGATGYRLYVSRNSNDSFVLAGTETKTNTSTYNIPANTTVYYKLVAFNSNGESGYSRVVSATTLSR